MHFFSDSSFINRNYQAAIQQNGMIDLDGGSVKTLF